VVASDIPADTPSDYTQFTHNATFKGLRLGIPRKIFFDIEYVEHQEILEAANAAINHIKSLGAIIQDPADLPSAEEIPACQTATEAMVCSTLFPPLINLTS
jgi:amidase